MRPIRATQRVWRPARSRSYTLLGDANLDGKVNGTDFNLMATNFNKSGMTWDQGDFNYDGNVNGTDFNLLATNFNRVAPVVAQNPPGLTAGAGAQYSVSTSGGIQVLDVTAGTVTLSADLSAALGQYILKIENGASVVLTSGQHLDQLLLIGDGTIDIGSQTLFIDYGTGTDPISSIATSIKNGYANGTWNGAGIMSSAAAANSKSYGLGYADSVDAGIPENLPSGTIEIKYTLLGDANLDGVVNGTDFDFLLLADNFNQSANQSAVAASSQVTATAASTVTPQAITTISASDLNDDVGTVLGKHVAKKKSHH